MLCHAFIYIHNISPPHEHISGENGSGTNRLLNKEWLRYCCVIKACQVPQCTETTPYEVAYLLHLPKLMIECTDDTLAGVMPWWE